jgi:hypothetical protein
MLRMTPSKNLSIVNHPQQVRQRDNFCLRGNGTITIRL